MTTVESCLIYGNKSGSGAGIHNGMNGQLKIYNTTITANTATGAGGGVGTSNNTKLEVVNCVIADNFAGDTYENKDWSAGTPTTARCNLFGKNSSTTAYGDGSILGLPDFRDVEKCNFHLGNSTQAKELATNDYPSVDLDGLARKTPSAAGCFEFYETKDFGCSPDFTPQTDFYDAPIGFDAHAVNEPEGKTLTYTWTLTDQFGEQIFLNGAAPTSAVSRAGVYSVVLSVKDGATEILSKTCANSLTTAARTNYVTCVESAGAEYPYDTPETAATNITDVLPCTIIGSVVLMDEGTHYLKSDVTVGTGCEIRGAGVGRTIIDLGGKAGRSITLNQAKAHLTGMTVCNAYSANNKGAFVTVSSGRMTDMRFTRLRLTQYKWGGAPVVVGSGQVFDRLIVDCCTNDNSTLGTVWGYDHAAAILVKGGSTLRNSLLHHNYSDLPGGTVCAGTNVSGGGLIENCTVVDNLNAGEGIEAAAVMLSAGGKARNCIVARNSSPNWSTTGHDGTQPKGCAPSWVARSTVTEADTSYNCWCESETDFGGNSIHENPVLFARPDVRNYRLDARSACYDAGLVQDWMLTATDLDGKSRIAHLGLVDLGCYERHNDPGFIFLVR